MTRSVFRILKTAHASVPTQVSPGGGQALYEAAFGQSVRLSPKHIFAWQSDIMPGQSGSAGASQHRVQFQATGLIQTRMVASELLPPIRGFRRPVRGPAAALQEGGSQGGHTDFMCLTLLPDGLSRTSPSAKVAYDRTVTRVSPLLERLLPFMEATMEDLPTH